VSKKCRTVWSSELLQGVLKLRALFLRAAVADFERLFVVEFSTFQGVQAEKAQAQADERKREKEAARLRRERLQMARDIEARAEAPNVPEAHRPTEEELASARLLREKVSTTHSHPCISTSNNALLNTELPCLLTLIVSSRSS
jgi:hypothetical protein